MSLFPVRVNVSYLRKTIPHRCVKCEQRRTLTQLWERYQRPPACRGCGYYRLYACRDRLPGRWGGKHKCQCGGYHFPHRKGSRFCEANPRVAEHTAGRADRVGV